MKNTQPLSKELIEALVKARKAKTLDEAKIIWREAHARQRKAKK